MTHIIVGYGCAGLSVALIVFSLWEAVRGNLGAGLISIMLALALLLVAVATLRSSRMRTKGRL